MKITITRQTFVGGELAEVGDVLDVDEKTFFALVRETKKAVEFKKPNPVKMTPPKVEDREKDLTAKTAKRSHRKKKR